MKKALIIGSSSKIGMETYNKFVENGYLVITTYFKNKVYVKDSYYLDITLEDEVSKFMSFIKEKYGEIDVLVNNAGICMDSEIEDKSADDFRKVLDVNLVGPFLTCKYVKKCMNKGAILNVSSTNGINTNYPLSIDYDASKAGLNMVTHDFAIMYQPDIRVNAIALGWVLTDMNKDMDPRFKREEEEKILLKRFANPREIANTIYFLCSDDASYINNSIIRVDGGYYGN